VYRSPPRGGLLFAGNSDDTLSFMNLAAHWHYALARCLLFMNMQERATAELREALRNEPDLVPAHETLAFLYAARGRNPLAIDAFKNALKLAPDHAATWFNLGFVYHAQNAHEEAIAAFKNALALSANLDRAWYGMGLAQRSLGRLDEAVASLKEAGRLQPMNPHAFYELGMTYYAQRRYDKVQEAIDYLDAFDPNMTMQLMRDTPDRSAARAEV
jgi:tetratricopeptide (TPR) repeat protein